MGLAAGFIVVALAAALCEWPRIVHWLRFHIELQRERHDIYVAENNRRAVALAMRQRIEPLR